MKAQVAAGPTLFDATERLAGLEASIPPCWQEALRDEFARPYFEQLRAFVAAERSRASVFPAETDVFKAFALTPWSEARVVIVGQDPYHGDGQAHGLCFSVPPNVAIPPSLRNILQELHSDVGCPLPGHGCLKAWAKRGVLLLNAILTVRAHEPGSHQKRGWETFTDAVIRAVSGQEKAIAFVLWGAHAQKKRKLIDSGRHLVIATAHPSPLSARHGFFGSRPFSRINEFRRARGIARDGLVAGRARVNTAA